VVGDEVVAAELVWENEGSRLASALNSPPPPSHPTQVRIGRLYDAAAPLDGIRLRPRGMTENPFGARITGCRHRCAAAIACAHRSDPAWARRSRGHDLKLASRR
jgi:hypothetical protein